MRIFLFPLIFFLLNILISAQLPLSNGGQPEIYMETVNYYQSQLILEKISTTYYYIGTNPVFYLCADCEGGSAVRPPHTGKYGWGLLNGSDNSYPPDFYKYGWGFYRIYAKGTNHFFYLDFRDAKYDFNKNPWMQPDLTIEFNPDGYNPPNPTVFFRWDPNFNGSWENCSDGVVKQIWKGRGINLPDVTYFPSDFWQNCLAIGKANEQWPHLIWGRYPSSNIDSYTLYRGLVTNGVIPTESNFVPINTLSTTTFDYEDIDEEHISPINSPFVFGALPYIALYYVKAKQGIQELERTNIVSVFSNISWTNSILLTQENNHPKIMWGDYHETADEVSGYRIRKRLTVSSVPSVDILIEKGKNVNEFVDNDFLLNTGTKPKDYVSYSVEAILANGSPATKMVSTKGSSLIQWKKNDNAEAAANNQYSLFQNTPNPFNPNTTISYQIPSDNFVTLKVYDVLGNEVATLVNEWKEAGSYNVQFTTSGKQLASGMYFYTLTAGKFTDTKKFILMK